MPEEKGGANKKLEAKKNWLDKMHSTKKGSKKGGKKKENGSKGAITDDVIADF
uniref:Uncharacterized protein n=1 Tax=Oryza sativa subsp. japonica TaxID=39947 RepID=Q2R3E4_ORYSJ|nr:hypothetical protein LOC_Os11g32220 [Oryza sativa Japonica Group]